jgi:hypothetical protein
MLSSYACAKLSIFKRSVEAVDVAKGNWWTGEKFVAQVPRFLSEFDEKLPGRCCCCIYDNSSNHGCDPPDALRIDKAGFNKYAGGKNRPVLREGYFTRDLEEGEVEMCRQSMFF